MTEKISVVIPCYNEEQSVGKTIDNLPEGLFEIIVVDNNCTDKTAEIARSKNAKVVSESIPGYGAAIKRGLNNAKGDVLVVLDGDAQYPGDKILTILEHLKEKNLDFVSCSRLPLMDKTAMPFVRRMGNLIFNIFTNCLFIMKLKDSQSGMWVFKRKVWDEIEMKSNDMPFSEELKIRVFKHPDFKFGEYAIEYHERVGESKLFPLKHGIINLLYLFKLRWEYWLKNRDSFIIFVGLVFLILVYILLSVNHITDPFFQVTSDVNGQNGMAAINLIEHGIRNLNFGVFDKLLLDSSFAYGAYYTNHPNFFVFPTVLMYKLFGVSEWSTRLGPLSLMIISIFVFGFALKQIYNDKWPALLSILILIILPGVIFYGKTFELAVFSLPASLITFSLFIFYKKNENRTLYYLFILSIILGGLVGWFYYLLPVSIWLYILLTKQGKEISNWKELLITMPIACLLVFVFNFLHFYILNGRTISNILEPFKFRTSKQPFVFWSARIWSLLKINATWIYLLTTIAGLVVAFFNVFKDRKNKILQLLPMLLWPLFVFAIFTQWSTHPFGVIYCFPIIATMSGYFLWWAFKKDKLYGGLALLIVMMIGIYVSFQKQNFFYNDFVILKENDIELLKKLKPMVDHNEVCLGENDMGIGFRGIADWYLEKKTIISGDCLNKDEYWNNTKVAIIFHPQLGQYYNGEYNKFLDKGMKITGCSGGYWCLMEKVSTSTVTTSTKK